MEDLLEIKEAFEKQKLIELEDFLNSDEEIQFKREESPLVSVLIVLYNRAELTLCCLQALKDNCSLPLEIIVVDNNSSDKTSELFKKVHGVKYIQNEENKNFLLGCNQANEYARGRYLLFLNNDAIIRPFAIENALKVFQEEKSAGAVGAKIILLNNKLQEAGSITWRDGSCLGYGRGENPEDFEFNFRRRVNFCSGAFLLTTRYLFNEAGGFDEQYAPAYYEETDYCISLQEKGYDVFYEPSCVIDHFEFASSKKQSSAIKLQRKNQLLFHEKHKAYLDKMYAPDLKNVLQARQIHYGKKILFIDDRIPHQDLGAGFPRSNQIINLICDLGFEVAVWSLNFQKEEEWNTIYRDLNPNIECILGFTRPTALEFIDSRKDYYDLIWVSRPHNMEFLYKHLGEFKDAKIIYDAEAIFSDRIIEKAKLEGVDIDKDKVLQDELKLAKYADSVITVKKADKDIYIDNGFKNVHILNVSFETIEYLTPFDQRKDLLFVGNLDYNDSPNVDSIYWFLDYVFPAVKSEVPDIKLHLVGTNKSSVIQNYGKREDVVLHGRLDDLSDICNKCKLFLAPTRYAAGSPAKVFMAAAYGIPVIATELIIQQVGWKPGEAIDGCTHTDPQQFAKIVTECYTNKDLWQKLSKNSLNHILSENSPESYKDNLSIIVSECLKIKNTNRIVSRKLKAKDFKNPELQFLYNKMSELLKQKSDYEKMIQDGEHYVMNLLEQIQEKDTEIQRRGQVIKEYREKILFRIFNSVTNFFNKVEIILNKVWFIIMTPFKVIGIFLHSPMKSLKYLKLDNLKQLIKAIRSEPLSHVMQNIAKKLNQ